MNKNIKYRGNPLLVQELGLNAFIAVGPGLISSQRTKITGAVQCREKKINSGNAERVTNLE